MRFVVSNPRLFPANQMRTESPLRCNLTTVRSHREHPPSLKPTLCLVAPARETRRSVTWIPWYMLADRNLGQTSRYSLISDDGHISHITASWRTCLEFACQSPSCFTTASASYDGKVKSPCFRPCEECFLLFHIQRKQILSREWLFLLCFQSGINTLGTRLCGLGLVEETRDWS